MKPCLLIATTNQGKFKEISALLHTLPLELVSLLDVGKNLDSRLVAPKETEKTLQGNALLKAEYYSKQTQLLTLADDSGLFIDALNGWPGVESARIGETDEARRELVIEKVGNLPEKSRSATFHECLALVSPIDKTSFFCFGAADGQILLEPRSLGSGFGYDPIFYLPELGKTYSELTVTEKNSVSHRGKALIKIKYHLNNTYGSQQIIVPFALIIRDGKVLMSQRSEPHRKEYDGKWEFPGGRVEFGETLVENLKREVLEEVGYQVEIVKLLQHIAVESQIYPTFSYQVFLVPYVCRIIGGDGQYNDSEVAKTQWVLPDQVLDYELIGQNASMYREILSELKSVIYKL